MVPMIHKPEIRRFGDDFPNPQHDSHESNYDVSLEFSQLHPYNKLVGGWPTPLKNMTSSVGMMTFPTYEKIIQMFQTTNQ